MNQSFHVEVPSFKASSEFKTIESGIMNPQKSAGEESTNPIIRAIEHNSAYKVVRELGRGSFGIVYLVYEKQEVEPEGPLLALKAITMATSDDIPKAMNEFNALKTVSGHPGVCGIRQMFLCWSDGSRERSDEVAGDYITEELKQSGSEKQLLCLVMSFFPEGNLQDALTRNPKHFGSPEVVVEFLRQTCSALAHCYEKNLMHRDIKPANILLGENGTVFVLTDFGLARQIDDSKASTASGGTLFFLAPEQLNRKVSKKSDVWALGCSVVLMLNHYRPATCQEEEGAMRASSRKDEDHRSMWMRQMSDTAFEGTLRSNELSILSTHVADVVMTMFIANPEERPSAASIAERLSNCS